MTLTKAVTELLAELQREDLTEEEKKALEKYQHWLFGIKKTASNGTDWHPYPAEKPTDMGNNAKPFLITIRQRDGYEFVEISVYHFTLSVFEKVRYYGDSSITAWAELPKPYKGE